MKTERQSGFYYPELDALRFWAFLQVFVFHGWSRFVGQRGITFDENWFTKLVDSVIGTSKFGVDTFFCLSSFLITSLLFKEWDKNGSFDIKKFWIRRSLRIWPLYFAFLLLGIFVFPALNLGKKLDTESSLLYMVFMGNFDTIWNGWPQSPISILWTVSVEEQFYMVWPLVLLLLKPNRLVWAAIFGLIISSAARLCILHSAKHDPDQSYLFIHTLSRLDPLMTGALFAVWVRNNEWSPSGKVRLLLLSIGLITPATLVMVGGEEAIVEANTLWAYPLISVCCVCILGAIHRQRLVVIPELLAYMGRISYGLYVFHMLMIGISGRLIVKLLPLPGTSIFQHLFEIFLGLSCAMVMTVLLAAISYRYLELPFLKLKKKFTDVQSAPVDV